MLSGVATFLIGGFYGGSIGGLLASWEQAGFFSYILPFLLIFALVFGILSKIQIFGAENKGLYAVISIVVGLLALQFDFVPIFFADIFPRIGIGVSVILALFILVGIFLPQKNTSAVNWLLLGVGVIVFLVVIAKSFGDLGFGTSSIGYWVYANLSTILFVAVVIAAIGAVIGAGAPKQAPYPQPFWMGAPPKGP